MINTWSPWWQDFRSTAQPLLKLSITAQCSVHLSTHCHLVCDRRPSGFSSKNKNVFIFLSEIILHSTHHHPTKVQHRTTEVTSTNNCHTYTHQQPCGMTKATFWSYRQPCCDGGNTAIMQPIVVKFHKNLTSTSGYNNMKSDNCIDGWWKQLKNQHCLRYCCVIGIHQ